MKKIFPIAMILALSFVSPALAGDLVPEPGMPFCLSASELQEYVLAISKKDTEWASHLKNCFGVKPGSKIGILTEVAGGKVGRIVRVRVMAGSSSVVGYGFLLN